MSNNMDDWKCQRESRRAAAHREGPLNLGGLAASKREQEIRRLSDELSREAQVHHKLLIEATMRGLRRAVFPDEIAHFRNALLKMNLTPEEQEQLRALLTEKNG